MRISRRRRTRRKFRLTREGRAFLFVTIGVGLAAVNTGNNLLFLVLGLLLSLLLVSGVLSDLALWRLQIKRKPPTRLFAGRSSLMDVALLNEKRWLSSLSIELIDEMDGVETRSARFLRIAPGDTEVESYRFEVRRRGIVELGMARVLTRYPFGLIEKGYTIFLPDEFIVYPQLLDRVVTPATRPMQGDAAPIHQTGRGSEFAGSVRFYREGDEARDIHWKRTASRGELVVREHEQDSTALVTLTVNNLLAVTPDDEAAWLERFEISISEVATAAAAYVAQGVSVQVQTNDSVSPLVAGGTPPDPIWRFLALLQPCHREAPSRGRPPKRDAA
jgi:uncharacterized protein (DUF58 family)